MKIITTTASSRWQLLCIYSGGILLLTNLLINGINLGETIAHINLSNAETIRSLCAIIWAPFAWNIFPRLEYRHRILSRLFCGNRVAAHYLFALYIVVFSSVREQFFFDAIHANDTWSSGEKAFDEAIKITGQIALFFGAFLSACGFYHLGIKYTYMGEYFGFMMPKLITSFPFSVFPDPMYNGSVLMHFGYAFHALSPTGLYLACVTGLSYWTAAKIFEESVMMLPFSYVEDCV